MDIPAINSFAQPDPVQPVQRSADPALVEATRQFEALFVRQFLGEALKPLLHATPESQGPGAGIYQYMMTDVISQSLAQREQFGISSILQLEFAGVEPGKGPLKGDPLETVTTGKK